ncbi:hypothetical protein [Oceanithermus desulfurans]|uniref:Uncharacterized protein n=2 Tax=Oceanithermus desulfurans TaxID=227924 RepID=A0A511RI57_9DEIN|nr:hypothetical protein [Oceanithermus desulfurans]MBB6030384.1 hypothetical protein [Oceanithermus desulfurans]GEM89315.1 hypothetical protein ODE01S_07490 [Oceanithermus desulfurans NBRC 100063]
MPNERSKRTVSISGTAIVLAAAALIAFASGAAQAAWALVWIYLASVTLVGAVIAWIGWSDGPASEVKVALGKESAPLAGETGARRGYRLVVLTAWVVVTATALLYLAFNGYPLMLVPALSLIVFLLPGAGERLIVDEYIQSVLVRASSVAHAAGLVAGFLALAALRPSALELFAVVVAVYAIVLEWAAWRELR